MLSLLERVPNTLFFNMRTPLQIRARYDKASTPYIERERHLSGGFDYRTLVLKNCPLGTTRGELEMVFGRIAEIKRFRIHQRPLDRNAQVYLTFRNAENAKRAVAFVKQAPRIFKDTNEPAVVDYPAPQEPDTRGFMSGQGVTTDASWNAPAFQGQQSAAAAAAAALVSKKARKLAASENRIVYFRQMPIDMTLPQLQSTLSYHGRLVAFHLVPKPNNRVTPLTAFAVFESNAAAASAVNAKAGGCTLPRKSSFVHTRLI